MSYIMKTNGCHSCTGRTACSKEQKHTVCGVYHKEVYIKPTMEEMEMLVSELEHSRQQPETTALAIIDDKISGVADV